MTKYQKCDRVAVIAVSVAAVFATIGFMPGGLVPIGIIKGYVILAALLVAFGAWLLGRLIEGSFHIPRTPILGGALLLAIALFLSALFSHTPYLSFLGEGFEQGTFAIFSALLLGLFLASVLFTTRAQIVTLFKTLFVTYLVIVVYQIVHLFFPAFTSFGAFPSVVSTPLGVWSDFAFFSGAVLLGSLMLLEYARPTRHMRTLLYVAGALSLFFVILANIFVVWLLVGFFTIAILVHVLAAHRTNEERNFPFLAFFLSLIALLFIFANSLLGSALGALLHISYVDVHPNLAATIHTLAASVQHHILFGAGPNTFAHEWLLYRPTILNTNVLWDVPFTSGSSLLGTIGMLGGLVGIAAMLYFLVSFGYQSVNMLTHKPAATGEGTSGLVSGLFVLSLYFLLAVVLFSPGISITALALILAGVCVGALVGDGRIPVRTIHFLKDQRAGFFSILAIVILLFAAAGAAYATTSRFAATVFYEKSLLDAQKGDLVSANHRLDQAVTLADLPLFERTRVAFAGQMLAQYAAMPTGTAPSDAFRTNLQNTITLGSAAGHRAVILDPQDPANYLALGDMLRMLTPLKIDNAFATAESAYKQAITIAPSYPKPYLDLATLYFDTNDNSDARTYVNKALALKPNYTDAYFLLAQIEIADGNTETAVQRIMDASSADPNNPDIYFELGLLRYNAGDYTNAASAFRTTTQLDRQYLNAWYYLALSDEHLANADEAKQILTALHALLPENDDVTNALAALNMPPPVPTPAPTTSTKQEKAKKLPLPASSSTGKTTTP